MISRKFCNLEEAICMLFSQIKLSNGEKKVAVRDRTEAYALGTISTINDLLCLVSKHNLPILDQITKLDFEQALDFDLMVLNNQILSPNKTLKNIIFDNLDNNFNISDVYPLNLSVPVLVQISVISNQRMPIRIGSCIAFIFSKTKFFKTMKNIIAISNTKMMALGSEIFINKLNFGISGIISNEDNQHTNKKHFSTGEIIFPELGVSNCNVLNSFKPGEIYFQFLNFLELITTTPSGSNNIQPTEISEVEVFEFGLPLQNPIK